jgi:hypothetical protein
VRHVEPEVSLDLNKAPFPVPLIFLGLGSF